MVKLSFTEFIKFDKDNIKERLRMLPTYIYFYGKQENKIIDQIMLKSAKLSEVKSTLGAQTRLKYRHTKTLKTETAVKDIVHTSEEVKELENEIEELNRLLRTSKLRMKTLTALSESITQYGHYIRLEKKQPISRSR